MKHFASRLVVIGSLLAVAAFGASRPRYGGTLHVAMRYAPASLDPLGPPPSDPIAYSNLMRLLFDTLVCNDQSGKIKPALSRSWQSARDGRHWNFQLRDGVKFDDESPLTAEDVAASLRAANSEWSIFAQGDSVMIDLAQPDNTLPAQLALARNSIVKRGTSAPHGTGPFRVTQWQPGKRVVLAANEGYWNGRPFLDSVEIELGKSYRDQLGLLQLGRVDLIEIAPEQAHRLQTAGRRISESAPLELIALVFTNDHPSPNEIKLRDALALSIDRLAIKRVLLGDEGDPAGALLPDWLTGYEFLFPSGSDVPKALELRAEVNQAPAWTMSYDSADPVSQLVAERIALNASNVGIRLQPAATPTADIRLVRVPIDAATPSLALHNLAARLALAEPNTADSTLQGVYQSESALLQSRRLVPLFHLPIHYGVVPAVKGWKDRRDASWPLPDLWLSAEKN
jgi:peptide/nickel transport system substrate-binding protein